jgi:catechol 2,3-dioxygenase-like lactoylglutathione lyase family enzyme
MASSVRLFRVIMPVTDLAEATRFYSALFGQPGFRVSAGRHYFECGGVILAVYDAVADGESEQTGDGGLPMGRIASRPWGERSFYMHDPAGNPICFVDEQSVYRGGASRS